MSKALKSKKYVYLFGNKKADGNGGMKPLLGGKGANLAEMSRIGLPVPPGFTITTEVCTYYYANKQTYPKVLDAQAQEGVAFIEKIMGTRFGDKTAMPLLVSVRSGARDSMPGMMDTILNLGLNDETVSALVKATKNERFAWDCYRRFIQMYGDVVMGVQKSKDEDHEPFEVAIHKLKHDRHHADIEDTKMTVADLKELVNRFKALIKERTGSEFPQDPWKQLWGATGAVFGSWMNDRAIVYRRKYGIPAEWGTAVNIQAMVYGNTGDNSGPVLRLRAIPQPVKKFSTANFSSMPRAKMLSPAYAHPNRSPNSRGICRKRSRNWNRFARPSSPTSKTCRTSSSRFRMASCLCSRPAMANAPASPLSASPSKWRGKNSLTGRPPSAAFRPISSTNCLLRSSIAMR